MNSWVSVSYVSGDQFRVSVEGGLVKYKKNGVAWYTSPYTPTYPLLVDTSIQTNGGTVSNVVISGSLTGTPPTSGPVNYVLQDAQGSTRVVMSGSSIVARHDFLPFGEEIGAGMGMRTTGQAYGAADKIRQRYGMTERDDASGLDHTWWRKYENRSGRWTSPDPLAGSIGAPQSFNRYSYVGNDPLNSIDPSGLMPSVECPPGWECIQIYTWAPFPRYDAIRGFIGATVTEPHVPQKTIYSPEQIRQAVGTCTKSLFKVVLVDFKASTRGQNGFFKGTNLTETNFDNQETYIVNEVKAYSGAKLARIHEKINGLKPGSVGRVEGLTIDFTDIHGRVTGFSPYRNFTANDNRPGSAISTIAGVNTVLDTQIWELGNSLSDITEIELAGAIPNPGGGNESAPVFQDCVRKELGGIK